MTDNPIMKWIFAGLAWPLAVISWLSAAKEWIGVAALFCAASASVAAFVASRASWKQKKIEAAADAMMICAQCRNGTRPPDCPWPENHLPPNCPKRLETRIP